MSGSEGSTRAAPYLPHPTQEGASEGSLQPLHARGDTRQLAMHTGSVPGFFFVGFFFFCILQSEMK